MPFITSSPTFIAVCEPLILTEFRNPAPQPRRAPPGKVSLGMAWKPPSFSTRAPYETGCPPSMCGRMSGWSFQRWNSLYGFRYGFS